MERHSRTRRPELRVMNQQRFWPAGLSVDFSLCPSSWSEGCFPPLGIRRVTLTRGAHNLPQEGQNVLPTGAASRFPQREVFLQGARFGEQCVPKPILLKCHHSDKQAATSEGGVASGGSSCVSLGSWGRGSSKVVTLQSQLKMACSGGQWGQSSPWRS